MFKKKQGHLLTYPGTIISIFKGIFLWVVIRLFHNNYLCFCRKASFSLPTIETLSALGNDFKE